MERPIRSVDFYFRPDNSQAVLWKRKLIPVLEKSGVVRTTKHPDAIIVLGGDGTIIEAVHAYGAQKPPVMLCLNIGTFGFLASVTDPGAFEKQTMAFIKGMYIPRTRIMIEGSVWRRGKVVFATDALNEIIVQNPLSIVELDVRIAGYAMQHIRGSGILISTPTGSTAFNLSAHGPIIAPDLTCIAITELLDHGVPTPSIIVKDTEAIRIAVKSFRPYDLLMLKGTKKTVNVLFVADGTQIFPLEERDEIIVAKSGRVARLAEFSENDFYRNLNAKFKFS